MLKVFRFVNCTSLKKPLRVYYHCRKMTPTKIEDIPPSRSDPIIKKIDNELFRSLHTDELTTLVKIFKKHNYEIRIAGGAVRDLLMDIKPHDLDFATTATPQEMVAMFEKENIRMINNKGQSHGTVTPRINDKENFEVTTLRIDTATDGRHAEVKYTTQWKLDALRRDLTINSMFLDLEGQIYDYFYGYDDLQARRVVFVGNPEHRIKEDYLRILRYFRFYGRIVEKPDSHDEETITAIKNNISRLGLISGERIWSEWSRIFSRNHVKEINLKMLECGIASYVGLPNNPNIERFEIVHDTAKKNNVSLQPISFVALMLRTNEDVTRLHERLKLSAFERDLAYFLVTFWEETPTTNPLKYYKRILIRWNGSIAVGKKYISELLKCKADYSLAEQIENTVIPRFPVSGYLIKEQVKERYMIGIVIKKLKDIWLDHDFKLTTEELVKEVPRLVGELEDQIQHQEYNKR